ncbi:GntR family transcriptional regulator [Cryobacterium sp. MLB-32]|uniref:FadR/GntR family transcriptional regulator n=1 Tax=Cryobacterium sp. MLB-32 TaxID=1529318 RepID=UPI0004E6224B|nr:FadR/GntR family transcriptional regulator [Cryobacterium sp. MLB-32]KFF59791.1 GntR family transcriptional regulator [Cryobacterium sp. MLB-32]
MSRTSLVDELVESVLDRVLRGVFPANQMLPPEAVLAEEAGVSRLTAREAIKSLQAQKIVYVRRGLGTFVNPPESWSSLDAILRAAAYNLGSSEVPLRLLEVRRMVESGSAELAAINHDDNDLTLLDATIAEMQAASAADDLDRFTENDLAFHDIILAASGNPFLPALMGQLGQLLYTLRRETSAFTEVQEHAIEHHQAVRAAIATRDPGQARRAMEEHLRQTLADYEHFIESGRP